MKMTFSRSSLPVAGAGAATTASNGNSNDGIRFRRPVEFDEFMSHLAGSHMREPSILTRVPTPVAAPDIDISTSGLPFGFAVF
jgi:hypothetical protein